MLLISPGLVTATGGYPDGIDFVKVQTAVNAEAGPLGEISTDVAG